MGECFTDTGCSGVDAILDQFFDDRTEVDDDLAGLNLVDLVMLLRWLSPSSAYSCVLDSCRIKDVEGLDILFGHRFA